VKSVFVTVGIPGSGKSTFVKERLAKNPKAVRMNNDDLCTMLFGQPFVAHTDSTSKLLSAMRKSQLRVLLQSDGVEEIYIDNTNLHGNIMSVYKKVAIQYGASFHILDQFLNVDVEECIRRDALRDNPVGEEVIRNMARHAAKIKRREKDFYPYDMVPYDNPVDGYPCIIVDLDGTFAVHNGRSPYDLSRVHEDSVNMSVLSVISAMLNEGVDVIFLSGRDDSCYDATMRWIMDAMGGDYQPELHMRKTEDNRMDFIVKYEIFNRIINGRKVLFVLDDRDQVVHMWRHVLKIPVWQVNEGDF
jgi:predicted kinase